MRISDWNSDVCSSDLVADLERIAACVVEFDAVVAVGGEARETGILDDPRDGRFAAAEADGIILAADIIDARGGDDQRRAVEADRNPGDAVLDPVAYVLVGVEIVARDDADAAAAVDVREKGRRAVCRIMRIERVGLIGERRIIVVSGRARKIENEIDTQSLGRADPFSGRYARAGG